MVRCLLALGSNLGDRSANLREALRRIATLPRTQLLSRSRWHTTAAVGGPKGQRSFLNGAAEVATSLEPQELGQSLLEIERQMGRQRTVRWGSREIDIDLLLYGQTTVETADFTIPHPRMAHRRFVLEPASDVGGYHRHPVARWTIRSLLRQLDMDFGYVGVVSPSEEFAAWFTEELNQRLGNIVEIVSLVSRKEPANGISCIASEGSEVGRPAMILSLSPDLSADGFPEKNDFKQGADEFSECVFQDFAGISGLTQIVASNPQVMLDEAEAAVRAAWPERFSEKH